VENKNCSTKPEAQQHETRTRKHSRAKQEHGKEPVLKDKKGRSRKEGPVTHQKEAHLIGTRCDPSVQRY